MEGGEAGAVILSLVQTCRGLGINPEEYLEDVMRRLMGHNAQKLYELLPDEWQKARQEAAARSKATGSIPMPQPMAGSRAEAPAEGESGSRPIS